MSVYIVTRSDGGMSIFDLVDGAKIEEEIIKWQSGFSEAVATGFRQIIASDLPTDRTFRKAWVDTGIKVDVDMPIAREIWRDKMRRARAPLLKELDVQFMQALEKGTPTTAITAQKQILRDVTADPAIELAKTPEELKAVWPAILGTIK